MKYPPFMPGEQSDIEELNIMETQTTRMFWLCHLPPRNPAGPSLAILASPPKAP
jgi:hypothetical protein